MRDIHKIYALIFFLLICIFYKPTTRKWSSLTSGHQQDWYYFEADEATIERTSWNVQVGGMKLLMSGVRLLSFSEIDVSTNKSVKIAVKKSLESRFIAGTVEQAAADGNRGEYLPIVTGGSKDFYFLSRNNGEWYSTNRISTRFSAIRQPTNSALPGLKP